jgi:hypothetical protein
MNYSVKYKQQKNWFWKKLANVKGDFVASDLGIPMRVFILEDETRIEVPVEGTEFEFCPKRFLVIKQKMEQEAGQSLNIK